MVVKERQKAQRQQAQSRYSGLGVRDSGHVSQYHKKLGLKVKPSAEKTECSRQAAHSEILNLH
ncbi:MAG: hypothetical protein NTV89_15300, partial [Proteobacteria bacterium]|nr:hypothetical protein [Pseudomonadota bacterium]